MAECKKCRSVEDCVRGARAQDGECAERVLAYCRKFIVGWLMAKKCGAAVAETVWGEHAVDRVEKDILHPKGKYDPAFELAPYLPQLAQWSLDDYRRATIRRPGHTGAGQFGMYDGRKKEALIEGAIADERRGDGQPPDDQSPNDLQAVLQASGFCGWEIESIRLTYAKGLTAEAIARRLPGIHTSQEVNRTNARFRDVTIRQAIDKLMRPAGFSEDEIDIVAALSCQVVLEQRTARRDETKGARKKKSRPAGGGAPKRPYGLRKTRLDKKGLKKSRQALLRDRAKWRIVSHGLSRLSSRSKRPVSRLAEQFVELLADPRWTTRNDLPELRKLKRKVERYLESDLDWVKYQLRKAGLSDDARDVYLRLWKGATVESAIKRLARSAPVNGQPVNGQPVNGQSLNGQPAPLPQRVSREHAQRQLGEYLVSAIRCSGASLAALPTDVQNWYQSFLSQWVLEQDHGR